MNQKISNAPVIGMIVAIMLLTLSVGVNIWLYNESRSQFQHRDCLPSLQGDYNCWTKVARDAVSQNRFAACFAISLAVQLEDIQRGFKDTNQAKLHNELGDCVGDASHYDHEIYKEWYKLEWRGPLFP